MEKNARRRLIILMSFLIFVYSFQSCGTKQVLNSNKDDLISVQDSLNLVIKEKLKNIDNPDCGQPNLNLELIQTICLNTGYFRCIMNSEDSKSKHQIYDLLSLIVDGTAGKSYVCLISQMGEFTDDTSFSMAIELLQEDYEPDNSSGHLIYGPVYEYINDYLVMSKIKFIDDRPPIDYFIKNPEKRLSFLPPSNHMEYYRDIKNLWESGRITLISNF